MSIKEFNDFYRFELSEILNTVETKRKAIVSHILKSIIIIGIIFLTLLTINRGSDRGAPLFILFIIGT